MPLVSLYHDSVSELNKEEITIKESSGEDGSGSVREIQQSLFPVMAVPSTNPPGGFFMNLLLKPNSLAEDSEMQELLVKKESKEFFAVVKDLAATMQAARWPIECQVIEDRIRHITYAPSTPEPYYVPTGKEVQPKPVGEELGIIVYQHYPISAMNYFSRSSINGSRFLLPTCPAPEEDSLKFESRFESGNLAKVIKISPVYYELYLRNDLYTDKHMQWFYFRVTNMKKGISYRFSIVNMTKDGSLFNQGMKPVIYSTKDAQLHNIGWRRCGNNISYFCNNDFKENSNDQKDDGDQKTTYTLTFTLEFPHEADFVYLAFSYPYTYTDLQDYLLELTKHPVKSTFTTLRLLCRSLAGNNLYYLTITNPQQRGETKRKKKAVVLTARVHPCEVPSSWMMKGVLDFLTSDCAPARELRDKFIFKIVPMLNPDGVIVGNTRCSLSGRDLNRQYRSVIRETYPPVWYTKLMIRRMIEDCGVVMYCDFHAHSRRHNIFVYGCENSGNVHLKLCEQVFPLMLHKNTADKFSFENCFFRIQKNKEGTGRVVMWMMGIGNSYTMEASFGGSMIGNRAETHFSTQDYENMGRSFCETLLDFYDTDPRKERLRAKIIDRLLAEGSKAEEPTNIPLSDYSSDDGETTSTSDELGRDYYPDQPAVPPSSPILIVRRPKKSKGSKTKHKSSADNSSKNVISVVCEPRRPYQLSQPYLDLDVPQIRFDDFSSDSEDSGKNAVKKKVKNKVKRGAYIDLSELKGPVKSLSLLDIGCDKLKPTSWNKVMQPPKALVDMRYSRNTAQQLAEVQTKLRTLKSRFWFGSGDPDTSIPLSWAPTKLAEKGLIKPHTAFPRYNVPETKAFRTGEKKGEGEKSAGARKVKSKHSKKKTIKKHINLQWLPADDFHKVDTTGCPKKLEVNKKEETVGGRKKSGSGGKKTGEKKVSSGLHRRATMISNARTFIVKKD